jgi:hypothetical protein
MLMVCMAGTAVKLNNVDLIGKGKSESLDKLQEVNDRLNWLSQYRIYERSLL